MIFTGDVKININNDGDWDIEYHNGQPKMADGFETMVLLSVFGEPVFWQNELTNNPSEKFISDFPEVIRIGKVNNKTVNDGVSAINRALNFMIDDKMAEGINVTGRIINVYSIQWQIDITKNNSNTKFSINWDKGVINGIATNSDN